LVPIALQALQRHSQNNMLYDPTKAKNISSSALADCDEFLEWANLPFTSQTPVEQFVAAIMNE